MTMTTASVAPEAFKRAAAMFPSGVVVVTSRHGGTVHGITVSAFSSLSLDPPQILVCVSRWSKLNLMIQRSNAFAANILASDQAHLSAEFARPGREPLESFDDMNVDNTTGVTGSPVLGAVAAYLDCAVVMACECGDHSVYMGDVLAADADPAKSPLLYFDRGYRRMDPGRG